MRIRARYVKPVSSPCLKNTSLVECFAVESGHGDGNEASQTEAGRVVLRQRAGRSAGASVLPATEHGTERSGLRCVLRGAVPPVLPRQTGEAVAGAGRVLPAAVDRILRRHGQRAWHLLAGGRQLEPAAV